jgi:hypothetical protein
MDYQLRPMIYDHICVWDFITSFDKKEKNSKNKDKNIDDNLESDCSDDDTANNKDINTFLDGHLEQHSHQLISHSYKLVAVPIGPSLPRRDHSECYTKYCRIMLILFKPWRHATDLREQGETWEAAFEIFKSLYSADIIILMKNMQLLHECQENGHDHFERLQRRRQIPLNYTSPSTIGTTDDFDQQDQEAVLEHLESISSCNSQSVACSLSNVLDCVISAEASGMYDILKTLPNNSLPTCTIDTQLTLHELEEIQNQDFSLEECWKNEYELRRDKYKQHMTSNVEPPAPMTSNSSTESSVVTDGSQLRNALHNNIQSFPVITQNILSNISENHVDIDAMIKEYTLNTEQA